MSSHTSIGTHADRLTRANPNGKTVYFPTVPLYPQEGSRSRQATKRTDDTYPPCMLQSPAVPSASGAIARVALTRAGSTFGALVAYGQDAFLIGHTVRMLGQMSSGPMATAPVAGGLAGRFESPRVLQPRTSSGTGRSSLGTAPAVAAAAPTQRAARTTADRRAALTARR